MTSSLHELDQVKFLQAYRFRWNASLIPLTDFFFWRIFHLANHTDWYRLTNVGGDDLMQKSRQNFGILLRRLAWGIMWGGERLHLESDLGAMTRFDKVSQANFNFSNLRLFMTFPKPQKSFTNFHPHTGISDTWFLHLSHLRRSMERKKHRRTALLETRNGFLAATHARCWKGWLV